MSMSLTSPTIKIHLISDGAAVPERATDGSHGYDLKADLQTPLVVAPGATVLVSTGVAVELPTQIGMLILPRSGLSHRDGLLITNTPGLIDSDFRGPVQISFYSRRKDKYIIQPGDRIAQAVFVPIVHPRLQTAAEEEKVSSTKRGAGSHGSTGK